MKNNNFKIKIFIILAGIFLGVFCLAKISQAAISLPWSCNFDSCSDWTQGGTLNCCGLGVGGGWNCAPSGGNQEVVYSNGIWEQISSAMPWGGTGKSQIHWAGPGINVNSGGLEAKFTTPPREIYIRYYIKYEQGFHYSSLNYDKHLYINRGNLGGNPSVVCEPNTPNIYRCVGGGLFESPTGYGWESVFSDYNWHWVEVHLRYGSSDGISEVWIDGNKVINQHNVAVGSDSNRFLGVLFGSNQRTVDHSGCRYKSYDNLAVSTTGPIGPVGATPDTTAPAAPTGVVVS